jgi:hypothetical protein
MYHSECGVVIRRLHAKVFEAWKRNKPGWRMTGKEHELWKGKQSNSMLSLSAADLPI